MLSRRQCGARMTRRLQSARVNELAALETYLSLNLFSWIRADYRTETGGKVTAFQDKVADGVGARAIDTNHAFAQGNSAFQPAASSADAALGGQLSSTFGGAAYLDSTISAANWKFCHDGSGCWRVHILVPTNTAATSIISAAFNSATLGYQDVFVASYTAATYNASGNILAPSGGTLSNGSASYMLASYSETTSPESSLYAKTALVASGASTGAPSSSDPSFTCVLGTRGNRAVPLQARWSESMWYKGNLTAVHVALVQRYCLLKYGLS